MDNLSSAHVYLRLKKGETIDDIKPKLLEECCYLVKANSIEGCKKDSVKIVYTPFTNIKKTQGMDTGQVGFFNDKKLKYFVAGKEGKGLAKQLMKNREEKDIEHMKQMHADYVKEEQREQKALKEQRKQKEQEEKREAQKQKDKIEYKNLMKEENMTSNKDIKMTVQEYEDDFM